MEAGKSMKDSGVGGAEGLSLSDGHLLINVEHLLSICAACKKAHQRRNQKGVCDRLAIVDLGSSPASPADRQKFKCIRLGERNLASKHLFAVMSLGVIADYGREGAFFKVGHPTVQKF